MRNCSTVERTAKKVSAFGHGFTPKQVSAFGLFYDVGSLCMDNYFAEM